MLYPQQNDKRNVLDLSGFWQFKLDSEEVSEGQLNPMIAFTTGKIKTEGDVRALVVLQGLRGD